MGLLLLAIILSFNVSAIYQESTNKDYTQNYDVWKYRIGKNRKSLTIEHYWNSPTYNYYADSGNAQQPSFYGYNKNIYKMPSSSNTAPSAFTIRNNKYYFMVGSSWRY